MTTPKRSPSRVTVVKAGDPMGPGGIPMMPGTRASDMLPDKSIPEPPTPAVSYFFQDTGEELERLPDCPDRLHSWWRAGRQDWITSSHPRPSTAGRLRLERGERVVITRIEGETGTRELVRVATVADREAHLADVARAEHIARHPEDGPYRFLPDIPPGWITADVREIIARWRARSIRAVVLGGHVALQQAAGASWTQQVGGLDGREIDEDLVRRYEPLLLAELEGRTLPCSIPGCTSPARAMARVAVPICLEHLARPVGTEPVKPVRTGVVAAIASAIGA